MKRTTPGFDDILDLSDRIDLLRQGDNLLAIQAMNNSTTSSDFIISAVLEGKKVETGMESTRTSNQLFLLEGLRVTELMYNAPQGEGLDYIELQNVTNVPLDLTGVRFTAGVDFAFSSMILEPGRCVRSWPAIRRRSGTRYGASDQRGGSVHGAVEQQRRRPRSEAGFAPRCGDSAVSDMPTCGIRPRTAAASP